MSQKRITCLDGLRGVACIMVVTEHYNGSLFPAIHLGFVANGSVAVAVFFLISGFVLTGSFGASRQPMMLKMIMRITRLWAPSLLSLAIACVVFYLVGAQLKPALQATAIGIYQQTTLNMSDIFGMPVTITLNPPLWTLVIEVWGSWLVICLVAAERYSRFAHILLLGFCCLCFGINELSLFTVGHFVAVARNNLENNRLLESMRGYGLGFGLIILGILSCQFWNTPMIIHPLFLYGVFIFHSRVSLPVEIGAILIFVGVILCQPVQRILDSPIAQFFGKLSFPIYLLHFSVMLLVGPYLFHLTRSIALPLGAAITLAFGLATTVIFSMVFEKYCDSPIMAAIRKQV